MGEKDESGEKHGVLNSQWRMHSVQVQFRYILLQFSC